MKKKNKYEKTNWTDEELLEMIDEIGVALAVVDQMPGYGLASNALLRELQSFVNIAASRGIRGYDFPKDEELLSRVHKTQQKERSIYEQ